MDSREHRIHLPTAAAVDVLRHIDVESTPLRLLFWSHINARMDLVDPYALSFSMDSCLRSVGQFLRSHHPGLIAQLFAQDTPAGRRTSASSSPPRIRRHSTGAREMYVRARPM